LIASGSEVPLARDAAKALREKGIRVRVVSLPCFDLFDEQPREYRDSVLPPTVTCRLAIEASSGLGWERYVGLAGSIHAIRRFGASAPLKDLAKHFGFTTETIVREALALLGKE
jgi:transketolase